MSGDGWCHCGVAENDPNHDGWHKLLEWNGKIFDDERFRRERKFEEDLAHHDWRHGRVREDPQGAMDVSYAPVGKTYSR